MSLLRAGLRKVRRSLQPTDELAAINARLNDVHASLVAHQHLLAELASRPSAGPEVAGLRAELEAVATANAEAMTYLNRSLREVRDRIDGSGARAGAGPTSS